MTQVRETVSGKVLFARPDALEIPDQQPTKVNPRRQRPTPVLGRIEGCTPLLDKLVETLGLQQLIQALIKRMSRSRCQLAVRDPDVLLLLPLLARPHRHAPILRTKLWIPQEPAPFTAHYSANNANARSGDGDEASSFRTESDCFMRASQMGRNPAGHCALALIDDLPQVDGTYRLA